VSQRPYRHAALGNDLPPTSNGGNALRPTRLFFQVLRTPLSDRNSVQKGYSPMEWEQMEWERIADKWAAMTHRLRRDGKGGARQPVRARNAPRPTGAGGGVGGGSSERAPRKASDDHNLTTDR
jgi:hypothetical protein